MYDIIYNIPLLLYYNINVQKSGQKQINGDVFSNYS